MMLIYNHGRISLSNRSQLTDKVQEHTSRMFLSELGMCNERGTVLLVIIKRQR